MTPFEVVYGQNPPSFLSYILGVSKVHEFKKNIIVWEVILCALKDNLVMDQNHMKQHEDQGRSKWKFVEGDHVFLQLQPYK